MFLMRLRMQEYREILTYRPETLRRQRLRICTNDDPIALANGKSQEFIADRAAHQIRFHCASVTKCLHTWSYCIGGSNLHRIERAWSWNNRPA